MKRILRALALATLALLVLGVGPGSAAVRQPRVVTAWPFTEPYGSFAESMAYGHDGYLYVSRTVWGLDTNVGMIERVAVDGHSRTTLAGPIDTQYGLVAGVAFDEQGRLYVALATFSDLPGKEPGVARVEANGHLTRVLTLPAESFPNGLAFRGGWLYVSDPALGAIWRTRPAAGPSTPATPWLQDPALQPESALGADGLAFRGSTLYVTQYDLGQILRADVLPDGSPGPLRVFVQDPSLVTADGIAFDAFGDLWVTVNGPGHGRLTVVLPTGGLVAVGNDASWLDYPTQVVSVSPLELYVVNGSFDNGAPNVVGLGPLALLR